MKILQAICFSLLACCAQAANVRFVFEGANAIGHSVKLLTLYPIGNPCTNGAGSIITRDWLSMPTGTNGSLVISNLYDGPSCGQYRGEFKGPNSITTNWFLFPSTNATIINASDWITVPTNSAGILAYSTTQADNRFLINYGSRYTNSGQWHWLASVSSGSVLRGSLKGNYTVWADSEDGLLWTAKVNPAYWEPNYYTNFLLATDFPHAGPWARDGAMEICNGEYWYAYNFDPFNTNSAAQGIGLARSTDGTNWSRHAVIYPMGTNNPDGRMFAPTWFTDDNGSNYLIGVYGTNISPPAFIAFQIRRLDNSFTNWSSPVNITPSGGVGFKWDAYIQREGANYAMYYAGSSEIGKATRANLNGPFGTGTDLGWGSGEAPSVIKLTSTRWRGLWRNSGGTMQWTETTNSGSTWSTTCNSLTNIIYETPWHAFQFYALFDGDCIETDYYRESFDGGVTWGAATPGGPSVVPPLWHGAGIVFLSASNSLTAAANQTYVIGTNYGQVRIGPPMLVADTINAKALNSETLVSRDGYFYSTMGADKLSLGSGDSTVMLFAGQGTPNFAAPNGSFYLKANGQPYVRTNDTWTTIASGSGGAADGFGPWATNAGKIYNTLSSTTAGNVGIGTNSPQASLHIRNDQADDTPRQLLLENRAVPDGSTAVGLQLYNRYMTQPWGIKSLTDELTISQFGTLHDFFTIDVTGNVGITNSLRAHIELMADEDLVTKLVFATNGIIMGDETHGGIHPFVGFYGDIFDSRLNALSWDPTTEHLTIMDSQSAGQLFLNKNVNVSSLTASRTVLTDSSKNLVSAAASGAVPINADGSATTFAQINALAPGTVLTNGNAFAATLSNNVFIMAGLAVGTNNLSGSNGLVVASPTMANVLSVATNDNKVFVGGSFTATTGITNRTSGGLDITGGANFRGNIQLLGAGSDILESGANDWALAHSFAPKGLLLSTAAAIGFSSTASYAGSKDVGLIRGAAKEVVVTNLAAAANWANLTASNLLSRSSQIILSNVYPFSANLSELAPCGCGTWMSNATLYLICTNSINSTATTNKLGGL